MIVLIIKLGGSYRRILAFRVLFILTNHVVNISGGRKISALKQLLSDISM